MLPEQNSRSTVEAGQFFVAVGGGGGVLYSV